MLSRMKMFWKKSLVLAGFMLGLVVIVKGQESPGMLVYMEPPIGSLRDPECLHFTAVRRTGRVMSDVILVGGQVREVQNAGILATILFPPPVNDPKLASGAAEANEQAKRILEQFPTVRRPVEQILARWKTASEQASKLPPKAVSTHVAPKSPGFTIHGATYSDVSLKTVDGDIAITFHSEGIARFPIAALSPAQIAFLNASSSTAHIDPDWAEKKKKRDAEIAKQKEDEKLRVAMLAEERQRKLIAEARQFEEAARYEEALANYKEANSVDDLKRVAGSIALAFESKKDYEAAAEYFEKAGLFSEAGRIRKSYNMTTSVSSQRLSSEEIFTKCAPATVVVIAHTRKGSGQGSGFFVRQSGFILTNHHVIDDAISIQVLTEGKSYPAKLISESEKPDLALLKIERSEHPILQFSDSAKVKPGATVYAIGTPKGLQTSITGGIVSSTDRSKYGNSVFQISALINHGNSGGPLLDERGKVIGVTTFGEGTLAEVDGVRFGSDIQGINYAIKGNEAKGILAKMPRF